MEPHTVQLQLDLSRQSAPTEKRATKAPGRSQPRSRQESEKSGRELAPELIAELRRLVANKPRADRLALTRAEAADALGISVDSFERYVQPEVRLVRRNSIRLVPVRELERWLEENAALVLGDRQ